MGEGLPLYHVERTVEETGKKFGYGSHIIYVNGAYKNDNGPIGRLVHDFGCVRAQDIYNDLLREQVHYFKETEGGRNEMCKIIDDVAENRRINTLVEVVKNTLKNAEIPLPKVFDMMGIAESDREIIAKRI